jgi:hypothetical protein
MADLTLRDAGERLGISPLQVVVRCALRGIPCQAGTLDEEMLPALGSVHSVPLEPEAVAAPQEGPESEETDQERRLRIVRRILEKLSTMGKFWPARTEKRSTARGLAGSDVGLALRAAEALHDCGLLIEETHGGHEPRVGLDGSRRREIADVVAGSPVRSEELRKWIEEG